MRCRACGADLVSAATGCVACGAAQPVAAPSAPRSPCGVWGASLVVGDASRAVCGASTAPPAAPSPTSPPYPPTGSPTGPRPPYPSGPARAPFPPLAPVRQRSRAAWIVLPVGGCLAILGVAIVAG